MKKIQLHSMVKNVTMPLCKDCKYFRKSNILYRIYGCETTESRCTFFGEKDIITGKIFNEYAWITRRYRECGIEGKYFEKR